MPSARHIGRRSASGLFQLAAEEKEIEEFLSRISTRSRTVEMLRTLIGAGEVRIAAYGEGKSFYQIAEHAPVHPALAERPVAKRPAPRKRRRSSSPEMQRKPRSSKNG